MDRRCAPCRVAERSDRASREPIRLSRLRGEAMGLDEVAGQLLGDVLVECLEVTGGREVQRAPLGTRERVIRHLADQVLHEDQLAVARRVDLLVDRQQLAAKESVDVLARRGPRRRRRR